MRNDIRISGYDYPLPEERIAKFPPARRDDSKLLVWRDGAIRQTRFREIRQELPTGSLLIFNNTRVVRARLFFKKESGARIEIFCLEPHDPADYERAFAVRDTCRWHCIVGNLKKWKEGDIHVDFTVAGAPHRLTARRLESGGEGQLIEFRWDGRHTFGELLEALGRMPIPPYLHRESEESDAIRYQTVYAQSEGSVAAPTAGLHFTPELIKELQAGGHRTAEITLHVGAGTFLPVKTDEVVRHPMHTEHFGITLDTIERLIENCGAVTAVGTTSVRTLESLCALGYRILKNGTPDTEKPAGQWEGYEIPGSLSGKMLLSALAEYMKREKLTVLKAATRIMIVPGYAFRVTDRLITNFHQPKSTLLLLVSAFTGERHWRRIYDYALENGFRFLSYGDSSLLIR